MIQTSLPIQVDTTHSTATDLLAAGRRHGLRANDAAYLVLAQRLGASLATRDATLTAACTAAGVGLMLAP